MTIWPKLWSGLPFVQAINKTSNKSLGAGHRRNSFWGDVIVGASLGPVFSSCSPTYFFIIATVLPASFLIGMIYLLGFTFGFAVSLLVVAYLGQKFTQRIVTKAHTAEKIKKVFGVLFLVVGLAIMTGYDKQISTYIPDSGYSATINLEEKLINKSVGNKEKINPSLENNSISSVMIPKFLLNSFANTDWSKYDPIIEQALSGGPSKDDIPALNNPDFISVQDFPRDGSVQALVVKDGGSVKAYPYNILVWHEIINDTAGGVPIAVTFCPLCGSAVVYPRTLEGVVTTFGVSGALLESNMIMYDRDTESLWQQSTGQALAGSHFGEKLPILPFQLMNMSDVIEKYPHGKVVSEKTGYVRRYGNNPYSGYEENEGFYFAPSVNDKRYPAKDIFVAFRVGEIPVAVPWLLIMDDKEYSTTVNEVVIDISKKNGELEIRDEKNNILPFYFEMWFSWAVQHQNEGVVFDPSK